MEEEYLHVGSFQRPILPFRIVPTKRMGASMEYRLQLLSIRPLEVPCGVMIIQKPKIAS